MIPTRTSRSLIILTKETPLSEYWYSVSWKKITPPRQLSTRSSAPKRICRNCLRFSSVFSTPTWARRFPMLPVAKQHYQGVSIRGCWLRNGWPERTWWMVVDASPPPTPTPPQQEVCVTDPRTRLQPGRPSLEKLYGGLSHGAPSSAPRRAWGPGVSS